MTTTATGRAGEGVDTSRPRRDVRAGVFTHPPGAGRAGDPPAEVAPGREGGADPAMTRSRSALAVLCAAQFLVVLDITVVNVALPSMRDELALSARGLHWAISAYAVVFGGLLLVGGRLVDRYGGRHVFLTGVAVFGAFSLGCGLAWDGPSLAVARAVQGLGAALVSPSALALLARAFPDDRSRARALGVWGAVGAVAASSGVLLGGVLVEWLDWRWIFLINVPVAAAALTAGRALPDGGGGTGAGAIDALGAALATGTVMAVVAALAEVASGGPSRSAPAALLATAVLLGAAFAWRERGARQPLVPRDLVRAPGLAAANAAGLLHGAMMLAAFLLLSLHMQGAAGMSPIAAGAGLLAARATSAVVAPVAGRLAPRVGARRLMVLGMAAMTAGLALLAGAPADGVAYTTDLLPGLLILGVAIPVLFLTVNIVALESAPAGRAGLASGLLNTSQWVGGALGASGAGALAGGGAPGAIAAGLWCCAALGVAGTLLALALVRRASRPGVTPAPAPA